MSTVTVVAETPLLSSTGDVPRRSRLRRMFSRQSLRVRAEVVREFESRRLNSKIAIYIHLIWNFGMVLIAIVGMVLSNGETTKIPLRFWIIGNGVIRILHSVCAGLVYWRWQEAKDIFYGVGPLLGWESKVGATHVSSSAHSLSSSSSSIVDEQDNLIDIDFAKHVEIAYRVVTLIWWLIGFYWISSGGEMLVNDHAQYLSGCTQLLMICDGFCLLIFMLVVSGIVMVVIFSPLLITALLAMAIMKGAIEVIGWLAVTEFTFRRLEEPFGGIMIERDTDTPTRHALSADDAVCIICLYDYESGSKLLELPCHHHFHRACIDKWLCIKSRCPLCSYIVPMNPSRSSSQV